MPVIAPEADSLNTALPVTLMLNALDLALVLALGLHVPASAEKADRDKPAHIEADSLSHDDLKQVSIFTGRAVLTKGTLVLRGARIEIREDADGYQHGVVLPEAGNLGGGGFMLVHLAKENRTIALDYREVAPRAASEVQPAPATIAVTRQTAQNPTAERVQSARVSPAESAAQPTTAAAVSRAKRHLLLRRVWRRRPS